jgi:acyl-CoA synthetase (AMP-forming)/AMP-acid ligase II
MRAASILSALEAKSREEGNTSFVADTKRQQLSLSSFVGQIRRLAEGFSAAGLKPGDRVLIAARPARDTIAMMLAIVEVGGVIIPIDTTAGEALFDSRMKLCTPTWIVAESVLFVASSSKIARKLLQRRGVSIPPLARIPNARFVHVGAAWPGVPKGLSLQEVERLGDAVNSPLSKQLEEDAAAMIVFTSGTTSTPKAVVHSHRSIQGVLETITPMLNAHPGDVIYARELHLIVPALLAGASVVVPEPSVFNAKKTLAHFEELLVTHFFGVAAELQQIVDYLGNSTSRIPATLREIWIGAAPVRPALLNSCRKFLTEGTRVWCVYGATEILPVARVSLEEKLAYTGEADFLGRCVQGVSARTADDGQLMVSGPNLCQGYYGESPLEEYASGDIARIRDGRIFLLGRHKDMIIRGRFNIYPELYESTIENIGGIRRCAMIGYYDDALADERVLLAVEPEQENDDHELLTRIQNCLRSGPHSIDPAALPDAIVIMKIPLAGRSSKIDKQTLREIAKRDDLCASQ